MAGLNYLKGKKWREVTREERFFCAELYFEIRGKEKDFVEWLNTKLDLKLDENADWEIGYEVCFYRDYYWHFLPEKSIRKSVYPQKRTFDLCLFGPCQMVIIEAKAYCGFNIKQLDSFENDRKPINDLLKMAGKKELEILILGLTSSEYIKKAKKFNNVNKEKNYFNGIFTWDDLYQKYGNENFLQADGQKGLKDGKG